MAAGISDVYFTSLRESKGETDLVVAPADVARSPAQTDSGPQAEIKLAHHRLTDSLVAALSAKLDTFSGALSLFAWPSETSPWRNARLVTEDPGLIGRVATAVPASGEAVPEAKFYSRGKASLGASGIDPGTYTFTLTQGDTAKDLTVTVASGDTWGGVLTKVADAVNGASDISVRADIKYQPAPFQIDPNLAATGTVLELSVNPLRLDQDVSLRDKTGHLVKALGLTQVPAAIDPAALTSYQVATTQLAKASTNTSAAFDRFAPTTLAVGLHDYAYAIGPGDQPTTYLSKAYDPEAATTLAPGDYTFGYSCNGESKSLTLSVKAGWTWGDVLRGVAAQINAEGTFTMPATAGGAPGMVNAPSFSQPGLEANVSAVGIPSATQAGVATDGARLSINTADPFTGADFSLTDGSGGLLATLGLTAKLTGTPVTVSVGHGDTWGDVIEKVAASAPSASARLSGSELAERTVSYAVPGQAIQRLGLAASVSLLDQRLGERMVLYDGRTGLLAALGMNEATPGQDGKISVNGTAMASENDAYSLDRGRLLLTAADNVAEPLPLAVVKGMEAVEDRLSGVVAAYNDLRGFLYKNKDYFDKGIADRLEGPVNANWGGLSGLGFVRTRRDGLLWVSRDKLWQGLYNNDRGAAATLAKKPDSLIPGWRTAVSGIQNTGARAFLLPETAHLDRVAPTKSEFDLEKKSRIIDLIG